MPDNHHNNDQEDNNNKGNNNNAILPNIPNLKLPRAHTDRDLHATHKQEIRLRPRARRRRDRPTDRDVQQHQVGLRGRQRVQAVHGQGQREVPVVRAAAVRERLRRRLRHAVRAVHRRLRRGVPHRPARGPELQQRQRGLQGAV